MSSQESANKFYSIEEILSLPDPEWLIQKFLPKDSFSVLFGPPSVGKSFLALSLALAIAAGGDWFGRTVKGGPVLYIAAEGFGGLKLRVSALLLHSKYDVKTECAFLNRPINFLKPDEVQSLIKIIQDAGLEPALIIIDTLARCFVGGDENSSTAIGLFIDGIGNVQRNTGATVLAIHHTGKDEKRGPRGSSALIGAADTIISCSGDIHSLKIKCEKMKDAEPFKEFALTARLVELENGRSSWVLVPFDEIVSGIGSAAKKRNIQTMIEVLERLGPEGASHGKWKESCLEAGMSESTYARGLRGALKEGLVDKEGDGPGARYRVAKSEAVSVSADVKPMS